MLMVVADWRCEFPIKLLLLLGRQDRANLVVGLKNQLLMLMRKILMQLLHLHVGIADQVLNLMTLVGRQSEVMIEPVDEIVSHRDPQHAMAIGEIGKREPQQNTSYDRQCDAAPFQAIAQGRYWFP